MARKRSSSSVLFLIIFGAIIAGVIYLYNSKTFEQNAPQISLSGNEYWNLKEELTLNIEDDTGIKFYEVKLITSKGEKVLKQELLISPQNKLTLKIKYPKMGYGTKDKDVKIVVNATDLSQWNFFSGNSTSFEKTFLIDKKKPMLTLVTNSYGIYKGGSALVVFRAMDDNLKDLYVEVNKKKRFKVQPFYKDGYYTALVAWPVQEKKFDARVIATDKAGNSIRVHIPYYHN